MNGNTMGRLIVTALTVLGAWFLLARFLPQSTYVAFAVSGFGITWMMMACLGIGLLAWKRAK